MADDKDGKLNVEARPYLSSCRGIRSDRKVWKAEVEVKRPETPDRRFRSLVTFSWVASYDY